MAKVEVRMDILIAAIGHLRQSLPLLLLSENEFVRRKHLMSIFASLLIIQTLIQDKN